MRKLFHRQAILKQLSWHWKWVLGVAVVLAVMSKISQPPNRVGTPGGAPAPVTEETTPQNAQKTPLGNWRFEFDIYPQQGPQTHVVDTIYIQANGKYAEERSFNPGITQRIQGNWQISPQGIVTFQLVDYEPKVVTRRIYEPVPDPNDPTSWQPRWRNEDTNIPPPYRESSFDYNFTGDGRLELRDVQCRQSGGSNCTVVGTRLPD